MKFILVIYVGISAWGWKGHTIETTGVYNTIEECENVAKKQFSQEYRWACMTEENYKMTVELTKGNNQ